MSKGPDSTTPGLPVTSGTRHLFVMSFTLRPRPPGTFVPAPPPPEDPATAESEVPDDADTSGLADFADLFG